MADLAVGSGNRTVVRSWDGQIELNRKREVLKWIVGLVISAVERDPPWFRDPMATIEGKGVIDPMPGLKTWISSVKILVSRVDGGARVRFEISQLNASGGGSTTPLEEALKRPEYVLWLYDQADGIVEAARDYIRNADMVHEAGRFLEQKLEGLQKASTIP